MKVKFVYNYESVWTVSDTKQAKNLQKVLKDYDMKDYMNAIDRMCNFDTILKLDTEIDINRSVKYDYYAENTGLMDVLITIYRLDYLHKFSIHYIWLTDILKYDGIKSIEDITDATVVYNREQN